MKHLKQFEATENNPIVGDYVIMNIKKMKYFHSDLDELLNEYINNSIGKIYDIYNGGVFVKYNKIPSNLKKLFYDGVDNDMLRFEMNDILYFGDKNEMEKILSAKKFNL